MNEPRITMATLRALAEGDLDNALISMMPGGIENQGAQGQRDFVASTTLPIKINHGTKKDFEAMGIVFGRDIDDLFCEAQLPEGWEKRPTDHSMWSDLVDDKGRKRAAIFYKAAFYDRRASLSIVGRFSHEVKPVLGYDNPDYRTGEWHVVVLDCGEPVWEADQRVAPEPNASKDKEGWLAWLDSKDALYKLSEAWLDEHYPEWREPTSYWD